MSWASIFIFCILVGFGILGIGYYFQWKTQSIEKWPSTYGTVLSAEVEKHTRTERTSGKNVNPSSRTYVSYMPVIRYEFNVSGKKYTSETMSISPSEGSSPESLKPVLDKYPVGQQVRVFYNPENPSDAVLEKVSGMEIVFYFIGGIWLTVWSIAFVVAYFVNKYR